MIYSFGSCELNSETYEFYREGVKIELERRVFDLLLYFLQNPGRLISREELLDKCWPGMYINDGTITTSLSRVRRAISKDPKNSGQMFVTVRSKGYRFLAKVTKRASEDSVTSVPESQASGSTPAIEARQLTVLSGRLFEINSLLATYDAEEIHTIMQTFYRITREVIDAFEGHLVHHYQNTILVYYGYPQAHEDDAQRAIRSGLRLLEKLSLHNLNIGVGIHTGSVIIEPTADSINAAPITAGITPVIAEQLSHFALSQHSAVVVSEITAKLTAGHFDWRSHQPQQVPGQQAPVGCYQILTDKQHTRLQANEILHGLTPFIGRTAEQALLLEHWARVGDGEGQTVLLTGDAGIGKSRLLKTLEDKVELEQQRRLECQCSPYHQHTPLYPLIGLLVKLLDWQPEDDQNQKLQKLEAFLTGYELPLNETIPLLAGILSLPLASERYPLSQPDSPDQHQRQQLLELLLTLLLEQCADEPLLLVVEDLHWIDPSTQELIDLLITQVPTLPMLLVLTARPEFVPNWSAPALVSPISLIGLNSSLIRQMLLCLTGDKALPETVLRRIVDKTDGIPLFIEELTHGLLESGQLQETEHSFEVDDTFDPLAIPLTLKDSLMARLDRLGEAKEIALWGAVIGREFSYQLLAEVMAYDDTTLQQQLNQLLSSGLLHQRGLARRAKYLFKHSLVQDITYQLLPARQRSEFHRRVAEVLEASFPEIVNQQPEGLARHYEIAGLLDQAVDYWHQAGRRAIQNSALNEALKHFNKTLALLRELPRSEPRLRRELALQTALGPVWVALKGQAAEEVEATYQRAAELCQQLGETTQRFTILWGLWRFHNNRADLSTARRFAQQLLDLAQQQTSSASNDLLLGAHLAHANTDITLGEFVSANHHIQQGLALYDREQHATPTTMYGGWEPGAYCLSLAALAQWLLGYPQRALQSSTQAMELTRQSSQPYALVSALYYGCSQHLLFRDVETTRKLAEEMVEQAAEHGFSFRLYVGKLFLGWALTLQDNGAEGIALMQEGLTACQSTNTLLGMPAWHYILADAYISNRQYSEALAVLVETFPIIERSGERLLLAELHRLKGECLLYGQQNVQQAEASFQQALSIAREQQAKSLELRAAMSLARLMLKNHRLADAKSLLQPVYAWFSEGFAMADLGQAETLLAQLE